MIKIRWPRGGMVDTVDSKSTAFGCAGSSPAEATTSVIITTYSEIIIFSAYND